MIKVFIYNNEKISPELIIKIKKNIKLIFKYTTEKQYLEQLMQLRKIRLPHYKIILCNTKKNIYKDIGDCMELDYSSSGRDAQSIAESINLTKFNFNNETNYFLLLNNLCKFYISPNMVIEILNCFV